MKQDNRDASILNHILRYCDQIGETITHFGNDKTAFLSDFIYQNAVALCILQIGELVGNLSDEYKSSHSDIPWKQIKAMRNIVAHRYGTIDAETVWEVLQSDIPELKNFCFQELDNKNESNKKEGPPR